MHDCLQMVDIQTNVCEQLLAAQQSTALAFLARTCQTFKEPALSALWREQKTLHPLIQVMPADLWHVLSLPGTTHKHLKFTRSLARSDWLQFDYYSLKIRKLGIGFGNRPRTYVHKDVLVALMTYRPVRHLLPSLQSMIIDFRETEIETLPFLQGLFGPSLLHLRIDERFFSGQENREIDDLLLSVARTSPNIRHLSVLPFDGGRPDFAALDEVLLSLKNLTTLKATTVPPRAVTDHLAGLPSLVSWNWAFFYDPPDLASFTTRGGRFQHLREFAFTCPHIHGAVRLLRSMRCRFEKLEFEAMDEEASSRTDLLSSVKVMADALSQHPSSLSLKEISIVVNDSVAQGEGSVTFALRPLFSLRALSRIELTSTTIAELDNPWLEEASTSWPHLEFLHLICPQTRRTDQSLMPRMTLAGLVPLLRHCPRLRGLEITLAAKPFDPRLLSGVPGAVMDYVTFPYSDLVSPVKVFRCLVIMFLSIGSFRGYPIPVPSGVDGRLNRRPEFEAWEKLEDLMEESVM